MKRALDVVVGAILLVAVVPVIVVAAAVTAVLLRSWPFFVQERVGRHGKTFRFLKIRTLPPSTPTYADKYAITDTAIPRFCRFLRDRHLDELPQLLLVVVGKMSLVGPRPEMPRLHAAMDPEFAAARTSLRPGCTGLWQISDASTGLIHEAPHYDLHYVRHRDLTLDLWIVVRTLSLVLPGGRREPLTIADVPRGGHVPAVSAEPGPVLDLTDSEVSASIAMTPSMVSAAD